MQQDSLQTSPQPLRELPIIDDMIIDDTQHVAARPVTPYQVLRMLPPDATPEQQDSAIQAWFQPGEIHYSDRPDTLHLPGHEPGRNPTEVELPQYYRHNFFSGDSLFHPEIVKGRLGVPGDPVPYTIRGDNMFTSLLLLCIMLFVVSVANSRHFIARQVKDFFFITREEASMTETSGELRFQLFLMLLGCLLMSISSYLYITNFVADTFMLQSDFQLISIIFGGFVAYFALKWLLYTVVNQVFFGGKKTLHFSKVLLFIIAAEGVLLFPAVLLQVYFDLNVENVLYYYTIVLFLVKLLTFYKSWAIFFRQSGVYLHTFLYFCALEIAPLLGFAGALLWIVDLLKINF